MADYITITEYAESRGISYEAVRQAIKRHSKELEGHVSTQNGKKYLDEEAVELLNDWKRVGPVVIYKQEKVDYYGELEQEVKSLREELYKKQSLIESLQAKIIELQIEKEASTKLLLDKQRLEMELEQAKELEQGMQMQIKGEYNARIEAEEKNKELKNTLESEKKKAEEEKELLNNTLERSKTETQEAKKEAEEQKSRADQIENSYKKTIFGLYKKKKD